MTRLHVRLLRNVWYWSYLLFVAVLVFGVGVVLTGIEPSRTVLMYAPLAFATLVVLADRVWGRFGSSLSLDVEWDETINDLFHSHRLVVGSLTVIAVFVTLFGL